MVVVDQVAGRTRYIHHAYEETTHWRIESMPAEPALIENGGVHDLARMLKVPPEIRLEAQQMPPVHPSHFMELFWNPSVPRPPRNQAGFDHGCRSNPAHSPNRTCVGKPCAATTPS